MKKFALFLAFGLMVGASTVKAQAQKFGYINSQELLSMMPEVGKADTALKAYAKSFQDQLEMMNKELEKKAQDFQANEKTMTDAVKEVKYKELQQLQERMQTTNQSAEEKLAKKKEDLFKP